MEITLEWLKKIPACEPALAAFSQRYPSGGAELNDVLIALYAGGRGEWATWLLSRVPSLAGVAPGVIPAGTGWLDLRGVQSLAGVAPGVIPAGTGGLDLR